MTYVTALKRPKAWFPFWRSDLNAKRISNALPAMARRIGGPPQGTMGVVFIASQSASKGKVLLPGEAVWENDANYSAIRTVSCF